MRASSSAAACSAVRTGSSTATGSSRSPRRRGGQPTSARPIANGAAARGGSLRWPARPNCRPACPRSTTGGRAAPSSARTAPNGADASLRLVGRGAWQWSALGYWQWRDLMSSYGQPQIRRGPIATRVLAPGQGALPWDRRERRGAAADAAWNRASAWRGHPAHERAKRASSANYVAGEPTRRRHAGGETLDGGLIRRRIGRRSGRRTVSGGVRIDHWQVTGGHCSSRLSPRGAVTRDEQDPKRDGWLPTARGGLLAPIGGGFSSVRPPISAGACRRSTSCSGRSAPGSTRRPPIPISIRSGWLVRKPGCDYAHGRVRLSLTGFVNRLSDAIANVTLGQGPGTFPGVGLVARRRALSPAPECRCGKSAGAWRRRPSGRAGLGRCARPAASAMPGWRRAARRSAQRTSPGTNAAASRRTLSAGWEQGGKWPNSSFATSAPSSRTTSTPRTAAGGDDTRCLRAWPLSPGCRSSPAARTDRRAGDGRHQRRWSIERATPRTLWIGLRLR